MLRNEKELKELFVVVNGETVLTQHKQVEKFLPSWKHFVKPPRSPLGCELAGQGCGFHVFDYPQLGAILIALIKLPYNNDSSTARVVGAWGTDGRILMCIRRFWIFYGFGF